MATDVSAYPYSPKSTSRLRAGDFWALPRKDGAFACGRVLQVTGDQLVSLTRAFFGGLLDWVGSSAPTSEAITSAIGGPGTLVLRGIVSIRTAEPAEWGTLPVLGYWGFDFILQLANERLPPTTAG